MSARERAKLILATIPRLGVGSTLAVAAYRVRMARGMIAPDLIQSVVTPPRFAPSRLQAPWPDGTSALAESARLSAGELRGLGDLALPFPEKPDWFFNPLTSVRSAFVESWWRGSDLDNLLGDIKGVWESSRFDWALTLARAARQGDRKAVGRLNELVADWIANTPPYRTLNWRCGQEAALRMAQLLLAGVVLEQVETPLTGLASFVAATVRRILPSLSYAIAQNNDHGFSEGAGLFIGGCWLVKYGGPAEARLGRRAAKVGRACLENRVARLIFADGGTANYSTNYHRFILDWLSHAELWRRRLDAPAFSDRFYDRAAGATDLLDVLTNPVSGDAPNLGSNDGARAFRLDGLGYRDFRPSVQLASATFRGRRAYAPGPWDEPLAWLGLDPKATPARSNPPGGTLTYPDFGLAVISASDHRSYGYLNAPRGQFRPQQADPLHFDLWSRDGDNLLGDGGTYSYFDLEAADQVTSIRGHNTVQFDDREPMRRISRFLYADWIEAEPFETTLSSVRTTYRDWKGASHRRTVSTSGGIWRVDDEVSGYDSRVVLRWRVRPGTWRIEGAEAVGDDLRIEIGSDGEIRRFEIKPALHSPGYAAMEPSLQIEVEVGPGARSIWSVIRLGEPD